MILFILCTHTLIHFSCNHSFYLWVGEAQKKRRNSFFNAFRNKSILFGGTTIKNDGVEMGINYFVLLCRMLREEIVHFPELPSIDFLSAHFCAFSRFFSHSSFSSYDMNVHVHRTCLNAWWTECMQSVIRSYLPVADKWQFRQQT